MADIPPYPLYNRTYNLYRISPLHHGSTPLLDRRSLQTHARRLKEQLKGDRVRGVQVDYAAADDTAKLGPLEECAWDAIGDEDAWIDGHREAEAAAGAEADASQLAPSSTGRAGKVRGIEVSLEYEKHSYNALLLRDPDVTFSPHGFTFLPLLLVKMPGPIRDIFFNYLRTAFDAHLAPLKLPSTFITSSLETYLKHLSSSSSTQSIQDVIRQLHVQLAFPTATTLLKHVEMTIAGPHVAGFVSRGKLLPHGRDKPFTRALLQYLKTHLALDMAHSKAHISRISCNSFHLGTERLKLAAPDPLADVSISEEASSSQDTSAGQQAVQEFYASLVREATGRGKFLPEELATVERDGTPSSTSSSKIVGRRKRGASSAAITNGNKKAKARPKENDGRPNGDEAIITHD